MTDAEIDTARADYDARCADAKALQSKILDIGELIRTQDNLATDAPMWIVQQCRRCYGFEDGYANDFEWCNSRDGETADDKQARTLDEMERRGWDTGKWTSIGYKDHLEFVTACFTKKGCEDYIRANGHNLCEPRIYADSSYRNEEFRAVRKFLIAIVQEVK